MRFYGGWGYGFGGFGWLLALFLVLFFFRCGGGLWRMGRWAGGCGYTGPHGPHGPYPDGDLKALDPICGMWVDKRSARHLNVDGKDYYFCSEACQKKFEETHPRG